MPKGLKPSKGLGTAPKPPTLSHAEKLAWRHGDVGTFRNVRRMQGGKRSDEASIRFDIGLRAARLHGSKKYWSAVLSRPAHGSKKALRRKAIMKKEHRRLGITKKR